MFKFTSLLLMIFAFSGCFSASISNRTIDFSQKTPSYTAAVVELNPKAIFKGTRDVVKQVFDIIKSEDVQEADILIFPEAILNEPKSAVLLPNSISFCDDPDAHYMLRMISCAARDARKYVVIDVSVKVKCSVDDQTFCANATDSTNLYNMAMVFDRYGDIIAKYRKYHLFNERGVQQTLKPDLVTFRTNFNVTFGVCICFDLMFAEPAVNLIDRGIKHFVYPTMWFSEVPYSTATQFQQSWAYANDVTLLAANANIPTLKSSGSGIYAGRLGALNAFITESATTKILIAKVPIDIDSPDLVNSNKKSSGNIDNSETDLDQSSNRVTYPYARNVETLDLLKDDLTEYNVQFLNFTENSQQVGSVCNNGICCNYNMSVSDNWKWEEAPNVYATSYVYAISVFNGYRYFKGVKDVSTAQTVCSLIACTKMDAKESCGQRIPTYRKSNRFTFKTLILETELPLSYAKAMPNTLTTNLLPLTTTEFEFNISKLSEKERNAVRFELMVPRSNLLTFAIFSRDYNKDITNRSKSKSSVII